MSSIAKNKQKSLSEICQSIEKRLESEYKAVLTKDNINANVSISIGINTEQVLATISNKHFTLSANLQKVKIKKLAENNNEDALRLIINGRLIEAFKKNNFPDENHKNGQINDFLDVFWNDVKKGITTPNFKNKKWDGNRLHFTLNGHQCYLDLNTPPKKQQIPEIKATKSSGQNPFGIPKYNIQFKSSQSYNQIVNTQIKRIVDLINSSDYFPVENNIELQVHMDKHFYDIISSDKKSYRLTEEPDIFLFFGYKLASDDVISFNIAKNGEYVYCLKYFTIKCTPDKTRYTTIPTHKALKITEDICYTEKPRKLIRELMDKYNVKITPSETNKNYNGLFSQGNILLDINFIEFPNKIKTIELQTTTYNYKTAYTSLSLETFKSQVVTPIEKAILLLQEEVKQSLLIFEDRQRALECCYIARDVMTLIKTEKISSLSGIVCLLCEKYEKEEIHNAIPSDFIQKTVADIVIRLKSLKMIKKSDGIYIVVPSKCSKESCDINSPILYCRSIEKRDSNQVLSDYEADVQINHLFDKSTPDSYPEAIKVIECLPRTYAFARFNKLKEFINSEKYKEILVPYIEMFVDVECKDAIYNAVLCKCINKKFVMNDKLIFPSFNFESSSENNVAI